MILHNLSFHKMLDNGGDHEQGSDNSPLRGEKGAYFNGGIGGAAFVTSPLMSRSGVEHTGLLHLPDWLPTLVNLAGGDVSDLDLDGFDVWESIRSVTKVVNRSCGHKHNVHGIGSNYVTVNLLT